MRLSQATQQSAASAAKRSRALTATVLFAIFAAAIATQTLAATTPAELEALVVAEAEAEARAAYPDASVTASTTPLDPRLTLAPCSELAAELRGQRRYGRISIAVSCRAPQSWRIFMNVDVAVEAPVLVTRRAMNRDEVLKPSDLELELRNLANVRQAHYTETDAAVGKALKRPLKAGQVLYPAVLKTPLAVRRGDRVTILAERGSVQISAPGLSLESGQVGEQIRVRNSRSEKIVHGWVRSAGVVTTSRTPEASAGATGQVAKLD